LIKSQLFQDIWDQIYSAGRFISCASLYLGTKCW